MMKNNRSRCVYGLILLLLGACATSERVALSHKVRNYDSFICDFNIIETKSFKSKLNDSVVYYSFFQGDIVGNKGSYYGNLLHGDYVKLLDTGKIEEQGQYRFGTKNGKWKYWNSNGELKRIENWKNGLLNGDYWKQDSLGNRYEINYKNNVKNSEKIQIDSLVIIRKYKKGYLIKIDSILGGRKLLKQKTKVRIDSIN